MNEELQLPQGTISFRDTGGDGPALVFVHGYMMGGDIWDEVIDLLAASGVRCIAPTWPLGAHPHAMASDADLSPYGVARLIADFIAALDVRDVTLVGNDSGGALCQVVATEHPERIGRLVLTPCDCFDNFPPKLFQPLVPLARVPGALTASILPLRLRAPRHLPMAFGWVTNRRPLPHDLIDGWIDSFASSRGVRRDAAKLTRGMDSAVTLEAARKLASFDRPVLLAFAADDKLFPVEHAERLARILPDARVETIVGSRTLVMLDQPARLAELIEAFVAETVQPGGRTPAGVARGEGG